MLTGDFDFDFEPDFVIEFCSPPNKELFEYCWYWENMLKALNDLRDIYLETKEKKYFIAIRQLLPMSFLYFSTFDLNYETLFSIYHQRKNHKLDEWRMFCDWILPLPYGSLLKEGVGNEQS